MTLRDTWHAWLGPAAADITDDQLAALGAASDAIETRWPDRDLAETRERALSAAAQVILGEATLESVGAAYLAARRAERNAIAALTGALLVSAGSERVLEERSGVARATVRKALGK